MSSEIQECRTDVVELVELHGDERQDAVAFAQIAGSCLWADWRSVPLGRSQTTAFRQITNRHRRSLPLRHHRSQIVVFVVATVTVDVEEE